jgi:hypothetical protein
MDTDDVSGAGSDRLRDASAASNCCDASVDFSASAEPQRVNYRGALALDNRELV